MNGTRADEDRTEEEQVVDDAGDDGGVDVKLLRRARLSAMLRELVRQEGAGRHAGGVEEAGVAALGAPGPHRGAVAEVAGPGVLGGGPVRRCHAGVQSTEPLEVLHGEEEPE